jgi:hypothetical protein
MNDALELYSDDELVMNVSAYLPSTSYQWMLPETFFLRHMSCWGWATWRRAWKCAIWDAAELLHRITKMPGGLHRFDLEGYADYSMQLKQNLDGTLSTWAVFWLSTIYQAGAYSLFPSRSLVLNTGFDVTGTHCTDAETQKYHVQLASRAVVNPVTVKESVRGRFYLKSFFKYDGDSSAYRRLRLQLGLTKHKIASAMRSWLK